MHCKVKLVRQNWQIRCSLVIPRCRPVSIKNYGFNSESLLETF